MLLPFVSALAYAEVPTGGRIPHCVLAVELDGYRGPADLVQPCVRVGLIVNPLLGTLAEQLGGRSTREVVTVPTHRVEAFLDRLGPGTLARPWPAAWTLASGRRAAGLLGRAGRLAVTAGPRRVRFELTATGVTVGGWSLPRWSTPVRLTPGEARALVTAVREAGGTVVECGRAGRMQLAFEHAASYPQLRAHAAPGLCELTGPTGPALLTAAEVLAQVDAEEDDVEQAGTVVLDAHAAELAVLAACAERGRAGLRPLQDLVVERYLASPRGLLVALAPGSGKTVATLAALAARGDSAVIAVPAAVRDQWRQELAIWYPAATCSDAVGHAGGPGPWVVLDSWARVAAHAEGLPGHLDAVVVDEANVLASGSHRARALTALRTRADRALALTGTPDQAGLDAMGRQLGWVRATGPVPLAALAAATGQPVGALCGPYLVTGAPDAALPAVEYALVPCTAPGLDDALAPLLATLAADLAELGTLELSRLDACGRAARRRAGQLRLALASGLERFRALEADPAPLGVVSDRVEQLLALIGPAPAVVCCDRTGAAEALVAQLAARGVVARVLTRDADHRAFTTGAVQVAVVTPRAQRGMNLQRAALLVHYDLPLGAGQVAQRTGRVARLGGAAAVRSVLLAHEHTPATTLATQLAAGAERGPLGWVAELVAAGRVGPG